eukprot:3331412-Rhodomonas_salina.3
MHEMLCGWDVRRCCCGCAVGLRAQAGSTHLSRTNHSSAKNTTTPDSDTDTGRETKRQSHHD